MAKRYTFRFETLLRLRRQREDEEKRVVAARLREIRRLEDRQRSLLGRIDEQAQLTRGALRDASLDIDRLKIGRHWMTRLRRGVLEAEAEISTHKALLAQERIRLVEAAKQAKILSRLKERRLDRWRMDQERLEQAESDEINTLRFAHVMATDGGRRQ
ncbi:MAG: flagellar export protein FliJ [Phycisphaerae bacterium]